MQLYNINKKMARAIKDMESFSSHGDSKGRKFIYRVGSFTGDQKGEGVVLGFYDGKSEGEIKGLTSRLDAKFLSYTDARADIEYCSKNKCWYGTYVVLYPFDNTVKNSHNGQNAKPLF